VFLYAVVSLLAHSWNPLKLAYGADGPLSTSKFQWPGDSDQTISVEAAVNGHTSNKVEFTVTRA
jgi:hypothetical protein